MKKIRIIILTTGITGLATLTLMARPPIVVVPVPVIPAPTIVVPAPAPPAVTVEIGVPDSYVWDGYEYVGLVGSEYYYLGPGNVWLPMDAHRLARFHEWAKGHADWRAHAIVNEKYRHDAHGHVVPFDKNAGHDHDSDHH